MDFAGGEELDVTLIFGIGDEENVGSVILVVGRAVDVGEYDVGVVGSFAVCKDLLMLDGFVNTLSLFSFSSADKPFDSGASSYSTRFLLGAKIGRTLTEGSIGIGAAGFRCSSINPRGAVTGVRFTVAGCSRVSLGVSIPGRPKFFWKCPIALASFRI